MLYEMVKHFALHRIILIPVTSMPAIRHLTKTAADENKYSGFPTAEAAFFGNILIFSDKKQHFQLS